MMINEMRTSKSKLMKSKQNVKLINEVRNDFTER